MSLDKFFGTEPEERCSNPKCRKILGKKNPKYTLTIKGEKSPYCRDCATHLMPKPKPKEPEEEPPGDNT